MFIYSLSHLAGEGMQKLKNGVCQSATKTQVAILGFSSPQLFFTLQPLLSILTSYSGADCCQVTRTSGWQKSGNKGPFFTEAEFELHPHVPCIFILQRQYKEGKILLI